jgi:hypothetical protein
MSLKIIVAMTPIPTAHLLKERGEELRRVNNNKEDNGLPSHRNYCKRKR